MTSCYDQNWEFLEKILSSLNIKYNISRKFTKSNHRYSQVVFSGYEKIYKLKQFIYPNEFEFGLYRKYKKCMECITCNNDRKFIYQTPNGKFSTIKEISTITGISKHYLQQLYNNIIVDRNIANRLQKVYNLNDSIIGKKASDISFIKIKCSGLICPESY